MRILVYGLIALLALAHQDCWWWDDSETLVLGVIPMGLAYHACVSLAAGILWALAVRSCWPESVDLPDQAPVDPGMGAGGRR